MPSNKILITGGFGKIGLPLANTLCEQEKKVYVIDNLSNKNSFTKFKEMNFRVKTTFTDVEYINSIWNDESFATIIHLAGDDEIYNTVNIASLYKKLVINNLRIIQKCIQHKSKLIYLHFNYDCSYRVYIEDQIISTIQFFGRVKDELEYTVINIDPTHTPEEIQAKIISVL